MQLAERPNVATNHWTRILDEIEASLDAAERGDLAMLTAWQQPAGEGVPMSPVDVERAQGLADRQRTLIAALTGQRDRAARSRSGVRKQRFTPSGPQPVYLDRSV